MNPLISTLGYDSSTCYISSSPTSFLFLYKDIMEMLSRSYWNPIKLNQHSVSEWVLLSHGWLFETPWTAAHQTSLPMEFSFFLFKHHSLLFFKNHLFIVLYNTVLVLPYADLNPPWVYMCSPSWAPLPPPSLPMEFSRQEYWNGLPFPSSGDLPNPGIKLVSLASPAKSCIGRWILYH